MNATIIKTEIEKISGYSFQDFQTRCKGLAFDCALVMQDVKAKYGRMITGDFLEKELGLTHWFCDYYRTVKRSKVAFYDPGFTVKYIQRLNRQLKKPINTTFVKHKKGKNIPYVGERVIK